MADESSSTIQCLNKYKVIFQGRRIGAIGSRQPFTVIVLAPSMEEARLKLYDDYEHISSLNIVPASTKITINNEVK